MASIIGPDNIEYCVLCWNLHQATQSHIDEPFWCACGKNREDHTEYSDGYLDCPKSIVTIVRTWITSEITSLTEMIKDCLGLSDTRIPF